MGTAETWKAICAGQSGIAPITLFDASRHTTRFAGEVKGFDPLDWIEKKDVKKCARFIQFALAATAMAMKESGLAITPDNATRVGCSIGSGIGGFEVIERENRTLLERGPDRVSPFFILSAIVNLAAGHVSVRYGAKGPNSAVATACTTGAHAIGDAYRLIQHGYADAMICGGAEASVTPLGVAGFAAMRALSTRNDDPQRASRPWDRDRDGFVVGEGSGILIIEERERALARGAVPIAEIVGYALNADAHHLTAPPDDGEGVKRVMQLALDDARLEPSRIQYLNAHATSTPLGDLTELQSIKQVFGDHAYKLKINAPKSMLGHTCWAAPVVETVAAVLQMRDGRLHQSINIDDLDPAVDLDVCREGPVRHGVRTVMKNSFGFGGINCVSLLRSVD